ncbi:MAG: zinc ABC transporter substrate-binding protein, partial [Acidobacteriota bacterium]
MKPENPRRQPWRHGACRAVYLLIVGLLSAWSGEATVGEAAVPEVVVSIPPLEWLVERIAGDRVAVESLLAPGDSPATFQPRDAEVTAMLRSRMFVRIGVPFENGPWLEAIARSGRVEIVDARRGIELQPMTTGLTDRDGPSMGHLGGSSDGSGQDPHIWLSPALLEVQAATLAEALSALDPDGAGLFAENLTRLRAELERVDRQLRIKLAPYQDRVFLVFHPSWGYFAHDYGLRQVAIEIEGKTPSDEELTRIQRVAAEADCRVVFS